MPAGNPAGYLTGDYLSGFFEQNPEYAYNAFNNRWGGGNQGDFYRRAFGDVLNEYKGTVGRALQMAKEPTSSFDQFLQNYDWQGNFLSRSPQQRTFGNPAQQASPVLNWLI